MTSQELVHGCWDKAQVSQAALQSSARMLFGYGSLIWKVDFETVRSFPCYISGFERRFWMKSADHRGTVESPGRVVTLVKGKTETSKVAGRAYEIPPDKFQEIIDQLDVRERHGYTREVAKIVDLAGDEHECLVYYNDPQTGGNAIMWNEEPAQTAQIIAHAVGPSGPNIEYLENLKKGIDDLELGEDPYLNDLLLQVQAICKQTHKE